MRQTVEAEIKTATADETLGNGETVMLVAARDPGAAFELKFDLHSDCQASDPEGTWFRADDGPWWLEKSADSRPFELNSGF